MEQFDDDDLLFLVGGDLDADEAYATPGELAHALLPSTRQTPALDVIDRALVEATEAAERGESPRLMIFMPPQEGKSERCSHYFPLWLLRRNHDLRIGIVSYDKSTAERWGRDIRNDINNFDGREGQIDLGMRLRTGSKSAGRWQLDGHRGGVYCVGIDGALTGRAIDVLVVDDPVKNRAEADSKLIRQQAKDFWTSTARTRFGPNTLVLVIQTRWHEDDLSGWLLEEAKRPGMPQWKVVNIPAQAEETVDQFGNPLPNILPDALHRAVGEWLPSARGRTPAMWEQTKLEVGSRDWAALYQQRPAPEEGNIFLRKWWNYYEMPRCVRNDDGSIKFLSSGQVIQSWDCAFKDTDGTDYVAGTLWQKCGHDLYLIDMVMRRMDVVGTMQAIKDWRAKYPSATLVLIEDKANGPAVISMLRKDIPGIVPFTPKDSKLARAYAVAPFCESGHIHLPAPMLCPWVTEFVDMMASFPNATHDDVIDSATQAITRLLLNAAPASNYMEDLLRERGVTTLPQDSGDENMSPERQKAIHDQIMFLRGLNNGYS